MMVILNFSSSVNDLVVVDSVHTLGWRQSYILYGTGLNQCLVRLGVGAAGSVDTSHGMYVVITNQKTKLPGVDDTTMYLQKASRI